MFNLGWVQYCSNTEYLSRLKLKSDSDSLLAGSGLHQIEFDFVQPHGAYSVYLTLVRTQCEESSLLLSFKKVARLPASPRVSPQITG